MTQSGSSGFTLAFNLEKETKNTFKYDEQAEAGQPPRIGRLYIQKWALGAENPPRRVTVTVEPASGVRTEQNA